MSALGNRSSERSCPPSHYSNLKAWLLCTGDTFLLYIKDSNLCSGHLYKWLTNFWQRLAHLIHLHPSITQQSGHHSGSSQYMFIEMRWREAKPPLCVDSSWSTLSVFGDPSTFHFLFLLLPYHPIGIYQLWSECLKPFFTILWWWHVLAALTIGR